MAKTEAEICKECKGNCCKSTGCSLSPEDMIRAIRAQQEMSGAEGMQHEDMGEAKTKETTSKKTISENALSVEEIERWLMNSNCALDSFSFGYPGRRLLYVRMRHKCFTFIGIDAMGECVALTDTGCRLSYEDRPRGGQMLIASEDHRCTQKYTREMMMKDWIPYQEQLKQIWKKWYEKFTQDGTFDRCEEEYMKFQRMRHDKKYRLLK